MVRVPNGWLDAIVYLFHSAEEAAAGSTTGGTGFIVSVPVRDEALAGRLHHYVVTNSHVVAGGATVARVSASGPDPIVELAAQGWTHHPDGDDLAVHPVRIHESAGLVAIPDSMLLTEEGAREWDIGPGDAAFFIGRFVTLDGGATNQPTVRTGVISGFPGQQVRQLDRGHRQESILVESRSLGGFSGAPVFTYPSPYMAPAEDGKIVVRLVEGAPCHLLGIDWGHNSWPEHVRDPSTGLPVADQHYVNSNSGIMLVVPAWKLSELLNCEDLVAERALAEARDRAVLGQATSGDGQPSPRSGVSKGGHSDGPR